MTMITTCQICGRAIQANTGRIALHGYRRPHQGWQTRSCFGARFQPYEVACDALPKAIELTEGWLESNTEHLAKLRSDPPAELNVARASAYKPRPEPRMVPRPEGFNTSKRPPAYYPGSYEGAYWSQVNDTEHAIRDMQEQVKFLRERLAKWIDPATNREEVMRSA